MACLAQLTELCSALLLGQSCMDTLHLGVENIFEGVEWAVEGGKEGRIEKNLCVREQRKNMSWEAEQKPWVQNPCACVCGAAVKQSSVLECA